MTTIPASAIVQVNPAVLAAGGLGVDLNAMVLTESAVVPIGTAQAFPSAPAVGAYFGLNSTEYNAAAVYFAGFDNSNVKPGSMLFTTYPGSATSGWLRGGSLSGMTLTQLKAITAGALTINFAGSPLTSSSIDLSGASSFSNAATIIEAAFSTPPFHVTFNSTLSAFVFTSTGTGATETIVFPSDTIATPLKLTSATGAVLSQGSAVTTPSAFMTALSVQYQNWATFFTLFDPDVSGNANKQLFADWAALQDNRYLYICFDTDTTPTTTVPATASLGYLLETAESSGTALIWVPTVTAGWTKAAFLAGSIASIDFTETNGRTMMAFRTQSGLVADVTDQTTAANLQSNSYNYYGVWATAAQNFTFLYPGTVTGEYEWVDSYINQIWLNSQFQSAMMVLLTNVKSIPYNIVGYTMIEAAAADVIIAAGNFGAYRAGVPLSQAQVAEVNNSAGLNIATTLSQRGWYFQVQDASPSVRQTRGSPPCSFWYTDGESIQHISLASILVQ